MKRTRPMFFVMLVMIFSCVCLVSLTYAWQSISQHATNELSDFGDVPVELLKKEKLSDGTETDRPVAGAVFYLFQEDGTQVGGKYVTDEEGKIVVSLPMGKYYFEEQDPGKYHTFDTEDGEIKRRYPFEVKADGETVYVEAFNILLDGDLSVHKTVVNEDGSVLTDSQKKQAFEFQVFFSDEGTYSCVIDGVETQVKNGDSIFLKHDQIAEIKDLPVGVQYRIVEKAVDSYVISSEHASGTIQPEKTEVSFVNTYAPAFGELVITKEVVGNPIDVDQVFVFEAIINGEKKTFSLKHGESYRIEDLAIGTKYEVYELPSDGYVGEVTKYEGTIQHRGEIYLPFVNVRGPFEEIGSLVVEKQIVGEVMDTNETFVFEITFSTGETQQFALKHGEQKRFDDLPHGTTFVLKEIDAKGYTPIHEQISGTIIGGREHQLIFENEKIVDAQLIVKKQLDGSYGSDALEKEFQFHIKIDGEQEDFVLKADEEKVFDLPYGSVYEVWEDNYYEEGYVTTVQNGQGSMGNETIEVVVTNTYDERYTIIEGEKTWDLQGHPEAILPDEIVVVLKNGEQIVDEIVVQADEDGKWKYQFEVPKYDSEGNEIVYTIEEKPMDAFAPSYDGYDIKNTYLPHVEVVLPKVVKQIDGEPKEMPSFTFVLEEQGEVVEEIMIVGSGEGTFSSLIYREEGEYHYTIYEKQKQLLGWTMDPIVYDLIVNVKRVNGNLEASVQMKPEYETFLFVNHYQEPFKPEWMVIEGQKTWDHKDNQNLPGSIIVELYGNDILLYQKEVTQADGWKYQFEVMKYDENQQEIQYYIEEQAVSNYKCEVDGYDLHNVYVGEVVDPPIDDGNVVDDPMSGGSDTSDSTTLILSLLCAGISLYVLIWMMIQRYLNKTG